MSIEIDINGLLEKPLWQMTGEEYCQLTQYALSLSNGTGTAPLRQDRRLSGFTPWRWNSAVPIPLSMPS